MNIREKEDSLFDKWMENSQRNPFVKDGCPSPSDYLTSSHKIVFLLKEANFGLSHAEQENPEKLERKKYDQRDELQKKPHPWWGRIGKWCLCISNPSLNWSEIEATINSEGIAKSLAPYIFVQLKKSAGGGSSNHEMLWRIAAEDRAMLLRQLSIYQPKYIVSCGLWNICRNVLFPGNNKINTAPNGINYYVVSNEEANLNNVHIVNFCHPSMRSSSALDGAVSFALKDAISHIAMSNN